MELNQLKILADESLWWLGFALLLILGFIGQHFWQLRNRRQGKQLRNKEVVQLWEEVQAKRKHLDRNSS